MRDMGMRASWTVLAFVVAAAAVAGGCKQPVQNNDNKNVSRKPKSFVVGRVVDDFSRDPLDATVTICGLAETRADRDGAFRVEVNEVDLLDSSVGVHIESANHATVEFPLADATQATPPPADSGNRVADLGVIRMVAGVPLTVRIVDGGSGSPVTGTAVVAFIESYDPPPAAPLTGTLGDAPELNPLGCREESRATTDAAGEVVFQSFDPYATYRFLLLSGNPVATSSPACSFLFSMFDRNDSDGDNGGDPDLFDDEVEFDVTNCLTPQAP